MSSGNRDKHRFADLVPLWLASALFGSFLLYTGWDVAWTLASNAANADGYAQYYAANAAGDMQDRCFLPNAATAECIREIVEATHEHRRAEADLEAQRNMAQWALWVVIVSAATLTITAIGVWYVRQTLEATLRAVNDTSRATDAMLEANEIARTAQRSGLRPWVLFDTFSYQLVQNLHLEHVFLGRGVRIQFVFHNFSSIPAKESQARIAYRLVPMDMELPPAFEVDVSRGPSAILSPNSPVRSQFIQFGGEEFEEFADNKIKVAAYFRVEYQDITSGFPYQTEICGFFYCQGWRGDDGPSQIDINFVPIGPQNTQS